MTLPAAGEWPVDRPVEYPTVDLLRRRARSSPEATALVDSGSGERWTYDAFDRRVDGLVVGLHDRFALSPGDRAGFLLDTGVPFAESYFATARTGATAVPLNTRLDEGTLVEQAASAALDILICDAETEALALDVVPDGVPVASVGDPVSTAVAPLERGDAGPVRSHESDGAAERLVLFTSGTTGRPKGVRLTLDNLVSSATASARRLGVDPGDRWLVCLPTYHMGGLAPLVRSTLYGTTTVLQSAFDAGETADVVDEYGVTCVSLVPTMLTRLLDDGWEPPERLRFVLLGGGPTPPSLVDRCDERDVPVCPTYGATETASQVATALPQEAFDHRGTVGRPLSGTTVSLLDESGASRDADEAGEIVVDGPTVSPGYLDAERTASAFGERGYRTGDVGRRDADGRLWVVGRVDDQIVTGGENVQPATVAEAIRQIDGVADAVVLGLPDEEWGERVGALVEQSGTAPLSVSSVREHCRGTLADYEVPKTVAFTDAFPRTASGTVDRDRARSLLEGAR